MVYIQNFIFLAAFVLSGGATLPALHIREVPQGMYFVSILLHVRYNKSSKQSTLTNQSFVHVTGH